MVALDFPLPIEARPSTTYFPSLKVSTKFQAASLLLLLSDLIIVRQRLFTWVKWWMHRYRYRHGVPVGQTSESWFRPGINPCVKFLGVSDRLSHEDIAWDVRILIKKQIT